MAAPEGPACSRFAVRVTARGGADRVEGVVDGVLRLRVTAPPADGQANAAVGRLLAAELAVRRGSVRIVAGAAGRRKLVEVDGIAPGVLRGRWPGLVV